MNRHKSLLLKAVEKQKSDYSGMTQLDPAYCNRISGGFLFNLLYLYTVSHGVDDCVILDEPNPYAPTEVIEC